MTYEQLTLEQQDMYNSMSEYDQVMYLTMTPEEREAYDVSNLPQDSDPAPVPPKPTNACSIDFPPISAEKGKLDVIEKYQQLMTASLEDESLYMRMKDTMYQQFKDLQMSEKEKAGLVSDFMTKFSVDLTKYAMTQAVTWAKEERDAPYAIAKLKAEVLVPVAQVELMKAQICETDAKTKLTCNQSLKVSADNIRANGVATATSGCTTTALADGGLVFNQTKQVMGATYQTYADAYRKSGYVAYTVDAANGIITGMSGKGDTSDPNGGGYTWQQQRNAERQRIAYEDAKRNHVANASASMIGQMLSADQEINGKDLQRWRDAIDYLNTSYKTTYDKDTDYQAPVPPQYQP